MNPDNFLQSPGEHHIKPNKLDLANLIYFELAWPSKLAAAEIADIIVDNWEKIKGMVE